MVSNRQTGEREAWVRARSPQQIEERRQAILDAAAELFSEREYGEVSLNEIARRARFTKSNVYRYFSTREEIFLTLYMQDFKAWAADFSATILLLPRKANATDIARATLDVVLRHERLIKLSTLLSIALERNSSKEAILWFKTELSSHYPAQLDALQHAMPMASQEDLHFLFGALHALIAGLWPMCNPNQTVIQVLDTAELAHLELKFEPIMLRALTAIFGDICSK